MSSFLWPHGLQHARPPCPLLAPGTCSNSYPSSWWCHPTISSSAAPLSSCLKSSPESESFPMSQLFASGGQSTAASVSVKNQNSKQHYQALSVNYRFPWLSWEAWGTAREDQQGLGSPRDLLLGQFSHLWNEMTTLQGCHGFMFVKGTQSTDSLTS